MIKAKNTLEGKLNASIVREYPELENVTITPTKEEQKLQSEMYGFGEVTVKAIDCKNLEVSATEEEQLFTGMFDEVKVNKLDLDTLHITPSEEEQNFTGRYKNVSVDAIKLQEKTITPTTEEQVVVADDGYDGLSRVTVGAVEEGSSGGTNSGLFTQLEYIESTGTQYIDTGYKPDNDSCYDVTYSNHTDVGAFYGAYNVINNWSTGSGIYADATGDYTFWFHYNGNWDTGIRSIDIKEGHIIVNKNTISVNEKSYTTTGSTFTVNYPLYIFGANMAGKIHNPVSIRIHKFSISESGVLVRDFVPMRYNKTGELGLFDLVNGVFYKNQGTGEFIAGPEV